MIRPLLTLIFIALVCPLAAADSWKAGVAAISITPDEPIHLLGYPSRITPFERVDQPIYAKALAVEDTQGNRGVIVTTDLVGLQDAFSHAVCDRILERTGLARGQIILSASHNHTGPLISLDPVRQGNLAHAPLSEAEAARTVQYSRQLQDKLVRLVEDAVADLRPAKLSWGTGAVGFVMNRRVGKPGAIGMGPNPNGVVDPIVPVLQVTDTDDKLRCILFGCACHNVALTSDHNVISGDYAGYAQAALEQKFPGVQAMFISGCGADANPEPRGGGEVAKQHGDELAAVVEHVLKEDLTAIQGPLRTELETVSLPLQSLSREKLQAHIARGDTQAMMAAHMLELVESGKPLPTTYSAPVAVWQFGNEMTLVALPGEAVADYADRIRRRLRSRAVWVSSYNNDCFGYLPTSQIVQEGGHEAIGVTVWLWGNHLANNTGFFSEEVESTIVDAASRLADKAKASQ